MPREQRRIAEHRIEQQRLVGLGHLALEAGAVPEVHHHRRDLHARAGDLRVEPQRDAFVRLHVDHQQVRGQRRRAHPLEDLQRRPVKLNGDLRGPLRQPLAGPQVERHTRPSPAVQLQPQRHERFRPRLRRHARLRAIGGHLRAGHPALAVLRADDRRRFVASDNRLHREQRIHLAIADARRGELRRRLHRDERQQLHQVVLDHVAQRARSLVIRRAAFDADGLGRGDLHVIDVAPVPDRLEHAVGEAKHQQVLDGLLAEVVVDAEDLVFREMAVELRVQLLRAGRDRCRTASRRSAAASRPPAFRPGRRLRGPPRRSHRRQEEWRGSRARLPSRSPSDGRRAGRTGRDRPSRPPRSTSAPAASARPRRCARPPSRTPAGCRGTAGGTARRSIALRATPTTANRAGSRWPRDRLYKRRQQLAARQVARRAEDHQRRRAGRRFDAEVVEERILGRHHRSDDTGSGGCLPASSCQSPVASATRTGTDH